MRKKCPNRLYLTWLVLLGLLFHVLVAHHNGAEELLLTQQSDGHIVLESGFQHLETHHRDLTAMDPHDHDKQHESHQHLDIPHSDLYLGSANSDFQDLLSLRLLTLFASQPLHLPPHPRQDGSSAELLERPPRPEPRHKILTTTILLI